MVRVPESRLRWLIHAIAFLHEGGAEPVAGLVLPNGTSFPDRYDGTPDAVQRLMRRVMHHAGLGDVPVLTQIVTPEGESGGSCSSGGCSAPVLKALTQRRVVEVEEGHAVAVSTGELRHPTALLCGLVRAASTIFLAEGAFDAEIDSSEREAFVDVAGVLLGFGVLLANGAHMEHKGCSGVTVQRATALPLEEVVMALAIACRMHGLSERAAKGELDPEPRRHIDEALAWADANRELLERVRTDRAAIEGGHDRWVEAGGWLSRLFRRGGAPDALPTEADFRATASSVRRVGSDAEKARRMAALRDVVDDALD